MARLCVGAPVAPVRIQGAEYTEPAVAAVIRVDLRDLPHPHVWQPGDPIKEIPRRHRRKAVERDAPRPRLDPLLRLQSEGMARFPSRASVTPGLNFDGQGFTGVMPPDTVGDAGPDYFIQAINHDTAGSVCTVYNKSDGSVAAGPFTMKSIHAANVTGGGDPIVLYDEAADRWLLSEFASSANELHIYISQTPNPISGGWYHYMFSTPDFPDYPKYGVWPDAYYVTSNESSPSYYALDRTRMLYGQPATMQRFTTSGLAAFSFQTLTPADVDGSAPPPGAVHIAMRHRDDEAHNAGSNDPSEDYLELFEFSVDWDTPANSTLTGPTSIAVTEFDSHLNGYTAFEGIPQPGTSTTLDPLREPVMWRLQYRNFQSHESLCGSFVTDVDGTDHAGVRWFELRRSGGPWALHDEGTYAPDAHSRWMPSAALDQNGNLAVAYNISSSNEYPGLRYTGRLAGDTAGTLTVPETTIIAGSASQISGTRYGDYAAMSVDPVSGCTFWFTGEYNAADQWSTRVNSFSIDGCGCSPPIPAGLGTAPDGDHRIAVSWSPSSGADSYNVYRVVGPCSQPIYERIGTQVAGTMLVDSNISGIATHSYKVTSYNATDQCESFYSSCVEGATTGPCWEPPLFSGVDSVASTGDDPCALRVTWAAATPQCGGPIVYTVYRDTVSPVQTNSGNVVATCLDSTSVVDRAVAPGVAFHYLVRAEDLAGSGGGPCGGGLVEMNMQTLSGEATGPAFPLFTDDVESGAGAWSVYAGPGDPGGTVPWAVSMARYTSPTRSLFCTNEPSVKDQVVQITAAQSLPAGCTSELMFEHYVDLDDQYDGGVLEYSTDNGTTWFDILAGNGGTVPANANRFTSGAYDWVLESGFGNPLSGRPAWSIWTGDWRTTTVDLTDLAGQSVKFRWRLGSDSDVAWDGWYIDDVVLYGCTPCSQGGYPAYRSTVSWSGSGDPDADDNSDGVWNLAAYFHGVNPIGPLSPAEQAKLPSLESDGTTLTYSFGTSTDSGMVARFAIQTNEHLVDGPWRPILPTPTPQPDGTVEVQIPFSNIMEQLFYRLRITE
ncbi:MAG: hypothetical protein ISS31_02810 [Kiritimatiellae bacterium]|nr:hypothetical protein [Kiritimatiellia bacterium]